MLDEKKKWFLLNSGGGAQAFDSPTPLRVASLDTTSITGWLTKVGADSYNWYLYDAAGTTLLQSDLATSAVTKTFSGLTVGTTYTVKVSANKTGFAESDLVSGQIKTFPRMPIFMYQFMGFPEVDGLTNPSNEFGDIADLLKVEKIKSVVKVDSNLDLNTTTVIANNKGTVECGNLLPYQYFIPVSTSYYTPTSPVVISGDVTIGFAIYRGTSTFLACLSGSDSQFQIRINNNTTTISVWRGGTVKTATLPSPQFVNGKIHYILIKYVSTNLYLGLFNPDDGTTAWGAATTGASTADITINQFFTDITAASTATVPWYSLFAFSGQASDEEIQRSFQYFKMADYALQPKYSNPTLTLKGATGWTALPSNGEISDPKLSNAATSSFARGFRMPSIADKAAIFLKQTLSNHYTDEVRFFDFSTNKYSDPIELPYYGTVDDDHNSVSATEIDNTILVSELYQHYDDGRPQNIYFRWFGNGFNVTEYTDGVQGNGKIKIAGTGNLGKQYQGIHQMGNLIVIIVQEWSGNAAKWLGMLVSKDRGNFFEYYRLIEQDGVDWFYPDHVFVDDSTIRVIAQFVDFGTPSTYPKQYYLNVNPSTKTVSNITGSYSKDVSVNSPVTLAQLDANSFEMTDGYSFLGVERRSNCRPHWDGTTLRVLGGNGNETGFIIYEGTTSGWTITDLDFGLNPVDFSNGNTVNGINNAIGIVGNRVFVRETIAGKLQVVEYAKNGTWSAELTRVGVLTQSSGYDYARIMVTPNSDYNSNHLIAAMKQDGGGAGIGTLWLKKLS